MSCILAFILVFLSLPPLPAQRLCVHRSIDPAREDTTGRIEVEEGCRRTFEDLILGGRVVVLLNDGRTITGSIHQVGKDFIQLRCEKGEGFGKITSEYHVVRFADIQAIKPPGRNWFWIGFGVGVGAVFATIGIMGIVGWLSR